MSLPDMPADCIGVLWTYLVIFKNAVGLLTADSFCTYGMFEMQVNT
jgi:hypothetical protein